MVSTEETHEPVRISMIAGRYFLFDHNAVAILRRYDNINGTLVGTVPQQPTQNIFLGLPIQIRAEEAEALVKTNAAYIVDSADLHHVALRSNKSDVRAAYVNMLKEKKDTAIRFMVEQKAQSLDEKATKIAEQKARAKQRREAKELTAVASAQDEEDFLVMSRTGDKVRPDHPASSKTWKLDYAVTPTSSSNLFSVDMRKHGAIPPIQVPSSPFVQHLQSEGFFITPGLRFGSSYSVYPGDPLRFHAHFMANECGWTEETPMLDLVAMGRLATAVKKAYLLGAQEPETGKVRTFSIEWANM